MRVGIPVADLMIHPDDAASLGIACRLRRPAWAAGQPSSIKDRTLLSAANALLYIGRRSSHTLSEGRLGGTNRLRRDLARNIAAYPAFLPILLSLQEGLFFSLYLARFSRNQR